MILVLDNASVAAESSDLEAALSLWRRVAEQERWSGDWARLAMAASDFSALCLQEYMDRIAGCVLGWGEGRCGNRAGEVGGVTGMFNHCVMS